MLIHSEPTMAVSDYEAQLQHQLPRLTAILGGQKNAVGSVQVVFQCLTKSESNAKGLTVARVFYESKIEKGKWLGYNYKVNLVFNLELKDLDIPQWIRQQFFLGISYNCDMDSIYVISNKNL